MSNVCAVATAAAKSVGEYVGPATVRIVTGRPNNEVEEVLSDAVREGLRRVVRRSGLMDQRGRRQ
jgi:hypothetical protein